MMRLLTVRMPALLAAFFASAHAYSATPLDSDLSAGRKFMTSASQEFAEMRTEANEDNADATTLALSGKEASNAVLQSASDVAAASNELAPSTDKLGTSTDELGTSTDMVGAAQGHVSLDKDKWLPDDPSINWWARTKCGGTCTGPMRCHPKYKFCMGMHQFEEGWAPACYPKTDQLGDMDQCGFNSNQCETDSECIAKMKNKKLNEKSVYSPPDVWPNKWKQDWLCGGTSGPPEWSTQLSVKIGYKSIADVKAKMSQAIPWANSKITTENKNEKQAQIERNNRTNWILEACNCGGPASSDEFWTDPDQAELLLTTMQTWNNQQNQISDLYAYKIRAMPWCEEASAEACAVWVKKTTSPGAVKLNCTEGKMRLQCPATCRTQGY